MAETEEKYTCTTLYEKCMEWVAAKFGKRVKKSDKSLLWDGYQAGWEASRKHGFPMPSPPPLPANKVLSRRLIECIELVVTEHDDAMKHVERLPANEAIVLMDLERKLYATRRCLSKRYEINAKYHGVES